MKENETNSGAERERERKRSAKMIMRIDVRNVQNIHSEKAASFPQLYFFQKAKKMSSIRVRV